MNNNLTWFISLISFILAYFTKEVGTSTLLFCISGIVALPPFQMLVETKLSKRLPLFIWNSFIGILFFGAIIVFMVNQSDNVVQATIADSQEQLTSTSNQETTTKVDNYSSNGGNREDKIKGQFTFWDGSHRNLTKLIKASMNDADSYEHIETRYMDVGTYIYVTTKFRGKNAFGGKVINSISAKVDIEGNVLEVFETK